MLFDSRQVVVDVTVQLNQAEQQNVFRDINWPNITFINAAG
jgi:hypothetical protein